MTAQLIPTRYIAIIHSWFIDSKGFNIIELNATDEKQADIEACAIAHKRNSDFNKTACFVLPVNNMEVITPRKLTWRERITGRIYK